MASEYFVDLCFIKPHTDAGAPFPELEAQLGALFSSQAAITVERKQDDGLEIAVAQVSGLSAWTTEQDVISHLEKHMPLDSLDWLNGYRIQVILKEDAGPCRLKRRGEKHELGIAAANV
ncbi:hypothetical protein PAESOLCIP111_04251 [Paenibacillus solanacearum]|uniref:Uncharacterized protein n=1 Tax=Paenibacillus solanacearum TaxID=2048548 RepID=A0A916K7H3_9BACL|nr:hypothetical protein [Paenibacillus solanacearum]CAG7641618.1 hypothetical protein PAESOLCIP111_04251 [Paenibacillus solanacearum]